MGQNGLCSDWGMGLDLVLWGMWNNWRDRSAMLTHTELEKLSAACVFKYMRIWYLSYEDFVWEHSARFQNLHKQHEIEPH